MTDRVFSVVTSERFRTLSEFRLVHVENGSGSIAC